MSFSGWMGTKNLCTIEIALAMRALANGYAMIIQGKLVKLTYENDLNLFFFFFSDLLLYSYNHNNEHNISQRKRNTFLLIYF